MKRNFTWAVLVGGILVVLGVLWQAFTIAAYVRGAGDGALDAHGTGSLVVHIGQLAIVIGALVAYWGTGRRSASRSASSSSRSHSSASSETPRSRATGSTVFTASLR